jgi:hypothetical protein
LRPIASVEQVGLLQHVADAAEQVREAQFTQVDVS